MNPELYRVYSTRGDMRLVWVAMGRGKPPGEPSVSYADVVEGVSAQIDVDVHTREAVDELFTREEAKEWCKHLWEHYDDKDIEMVKVPLPLEQDSKSLVYHRGSRNLKRPGTETKHPFGGFEVYGLPTDG